MSLPAIGAPDRAPVWVRYVLILSGGLAAVALFLLATATANTTLFGEHYPQLLMLNGAVAVVLLVLVAYQLYNLRRRVKAGVFGSKLTVRLVAMLSLMALLPGALIYGVSVQFLGRSIESWFEVRIDKALEGGLNLGRNALDNMLQDLAGKSEAMALSLSVRPPSEHVGALNALREKAGAQEATLFTERGRVVAHSGNEKVGILPDPPGAEAMRKVRAQQTYAAIESIPDRGLYLRVLSPVSVASLLEEGRVLQLLQQVPPQLAQDADTVQTGYREYQELQLARRGLKRLYGVTLTLTLLLALLSALAASFLLSEKLSAPLNFLVEGTRAVAQGDFRQRAAVSSRDELGQLTESFNSMTLQLADARAQAERNQAEVVASKAYLEGLLANLSAGVLAFDERLRLRSANPSASAILGLPCDQLVGRAVRDWPEDQAGLATLAQCIEDSFREMRSGTWEEQIERETASGTQMLLLRGTRMPAHAERGYVVVFDEVTHLLQAQRDAAWAEVARRLAHEIKNPLTPIQLSAERMQLKLSPKLAGPDAEMLARSTQTIVNQVDALKRMVDAFSQYARTPDPSMRELSINDLVGEVLTLYESLGSRMRLSLAPDVPPVIGDAAQLRQVIHNLLQNAQDALAETADPSIVVATDTGDGRVCLSVTDNGTGFPETMMKRAFEPYVTTKARGSGLGLMIVKKIVEEHGGTVAIANVVPHGARVTISLPRAQDGRQSARQSAA